MSTTTPIEKLTSLIKDIQIAMLTTAMPDGSLRSRPMATQKPDADGRLWFFTDRRHAKVDEIRRDVHVNVSYASPDDNRYVSVSGTATVVNDREKIRSLWNPFYKAWFPEGPDDPNIALLAVDIGEAEYWDAPSSTMVHIVGFVKAIATGQRYEPGEHAKLHLQ